MASTERVTPVKRLVNDEFWQSMKGPKTLDDVDPSIIFQNEDYCVIDKPPGVRMDGDFPVTVEKLLAKWTGRETKWMHQLDFATSGALCIGFHRDAVSAVVSSFEHRSVRKVYLAVLEGHLHVENWPMSSPAGTTSAVVEEHRQSLVATNKNLKRKLEALLDPAERTPKWQDHVMAENLRRSLSAFHDLRSATARREALSPALQQELLSLERHSNEEFEQGPKLRKTLRKFLSKAGIQIEFLSSNHEGASAEAVGEDTNTSTPVPPVTAPDSPRSNQEASESCQQALSEEALETICANYRSPTSTAITRITSSSLLRNIDDPTLSIADRAIVHLLQASPLACTEHLLVDIPVAELEDDFRMEPGHPANPGKKATTEVFVLERGYFRGIPITKVLMKPISGRRHQLRIHSRCLGHPILGDFTYNPTQRQAIDERHRLRQAREFAAADAVIVAPRMMLHAYAITIPFPQSGKCTLPFKRQLLARKQVQQRRLEHPEQDEKDIAAAVQQSLRALSASALRDIVVEEPLIDLVAPDPFLWTKTTTSTASSSPESRLELCVTLPACFQTPGPQATVDSSV